MLAARGVSAPPPSLDSVDAADLATLRRRIAFAGFDDEFFWVTEAIGAGMIEPLRLPLVRDALATRGDAVACLALLLVYATPVRERDFRDAIGDGPANLLMRCGVVEPDADEMVRSAVRMTPFGELLIVADRRDAGSDAVMAPSTSTALLANLLPEDLSSLPGRLLDVGTGPGTLALLAAARGATVVATDVSTRALEFAAFNMALNAVVVDLRQGDLLAPVAGDEFGTVLSQPPYVVLPRGVEEIAFMHGGVRGDEVALRLAAGVPMVLAPGGLALLRFDMTLADGESAAGRVRVAVGPELSVAVFELPGGSFHSQAVAYGAHHDPTLGAEFAARARTYCAHYAAMGAQRTASCTVALARPSDPGAPRFTAGVRGSVLTGWDALDRHLAALDHAVQDDGVILGLRIRAATGLRLSVERDLHEGGERRYFARFPVEGPLSDVELAPFEAALLQRIGAGARVADVVAGFADEVEAELAAAAEPVLAFVRKNLVTGLLALAD